MTTDLYPKCSDVYGPSPSPNSSQLDRNDDKDGEQKEKQIKRQERESLSKINSRQQQGTKRTNNRGGVVVVFLAGAGMCGHTGHKRPSSFASGRRGARTPHASAETKFGAECFWDSGEQ